MLQASRSAAIRAPGGRPVLLLLLIAVCLASSCTGRYARNRARDAADIFTVEVQTRSYGVSARLGPIKAGLNYKSPSGFAGGLRGGNFGRHHSAEFTTLLFGADYFSGKPLRLDPPPPRKIAEDEEEDPDAAGATDAVAATAAAEDRLAPAVTGLPGDQTETAGKPEAASADSDFTVEIFAQRKKEFLARSPFGTQHSAEATRSLLKSSRTKFSPLYYYTQAEVTVGLFVGIKIGVNFGEILDFLLGFAGIDIMGDDEPFVPPELERLRASPVWDRLDEETKRQIIEQTGGE